MPRGRWLLDARAAACPVSLDHQESQAKLVNQANQDHLAHLDSLAVLHWRSADPSLHHHASHAHQVHLAQLDHLEKLAHQDQTAIQAPLVKMAVLAQVDPQAHQVHLAHLARTERKDQPARQLLVYLLLQAKLAPLAKMDHQDQPVNQVLLALMAAQAQPDPRVHQALLVPLATMAPQETKAHLAQMATRESPVSAPSTAPPMVVSSSRMEQGDKRYHLRTIIRNSGLSSDDMGFCQPILKTYFPFITLPIVPIFFYAAS